MRGEVYLGRYVVGLHYSMPGPHKVITETVDQKWPKAGKMP